MDEEFLNAIENDDLNTVERLIYQMTAYTIYDGMKMAAKLHHYDILEYFFNGFSGGFYTIYDDIVKQALLDNDIENIQYVYKKNPNFSPRYISTSGFDQTLQYLRLAIQTGNDDIIQLVMDHTQLGMYHVKYILQQQDLKFVKMMIQARVAPFAIIRQLDPLIGTLWVNDDDALPEKFKDEVAFYIFTLPQVTNDPTFFNRLSDRYKKKYVEMLLIEPTMALRGVETSQGHLPIQIVEQILQDSYNVDSTLGLANTIRIIDNVLNF